MVFLHKFSYFCNLIEVGTGQTLLRSAWASLLEISKREASRELTWDWRSAMRVLVDEFGAESG